MMTTTKELAMLNAILNRAELADDLLALVWMTSVASTQADAAVVNSLEVKGLVRVRTYETPVGAGESRIALTPAGLAQRGVGTRGN